MSRTIDNNQDVLDSRDIQDRIEELEALEEAVKDAEADDKDATDMSRDMSRAILLNAKDHFGEDEQEELKTLRALAEDVGGEWHDGVTLIRDDYFEDYAQELAEETCDIKAADQWPFTCIDWGMAADALRSDYSSVEWDGVTFWYRS